MNCRALTKKGERCMLKVKNNTNGICHIHSRCKPKGRNDIDRVQGREGFTGKIANQTSEDNRKQQVGIIMHTNVNDNETYDKTESVFYSCLFRTLSTLGCIAIIMQKSILPWYDC
jgi:hypothetical protein